MSSPGTEFFGVGYVNFPVVDYPKGKGIVTYLCQCCHYLS